VNYWPRWIRAIRGKTLTLSMAQMGAYDRLLDYYYEEEKPLPSEVDECCRIAGAVSKQDRADVKKVLDKFFVLSEAGFNQERADAEIILGRHKIAIAKANGKAGGRPKGSGKKPSGLPSGLADGNPEQTYGEPTGKAPHPQKEITSEANASAGDAGSAELTKAELWKAGKSLLQTQGMPLDQCGSFVGKLVKDYGDAIVLDAVRTTVVERPADAATFLVGVCKHAAGKRGPKSNGKHAGFENMDYHQGVAQDGSLV
jgi:uncharacterized protein YdaU (DUF1376 family)